MVCAVKLKGVKFYVTRCVPGGVIPQSTYMYMYLEIREIGRYTDGSLGHGVVGEYIYGEIKAMFIGLWCA